MISMPEDLPDDPVLLKQLLAQLLIERTADKGHIVDLKEQIKLLRDRLFGRKSEQTGRTQHTANGTVQRTRKRANATRRRR